MKLTQMPHAAARLAAAALAAAGLALGVGATAHADEVFPRPELLTVEAAPGSATVARVTFRDNAIGETHYKLAAQEVRTDDKIVALSKVGPSVPGNGSIATREIEGFDPGARYCFTVQAQRIGGSFDTSPRSTTICYTMPVLPSIPADKLDDALKPIPATFRPDLVAVRVSGNTTLMDGVASVYEVVVRNDGNVRGHAQVAIVFGGSLDAWDVAQTPAGFLCDMGATIVCQGSLGGASDPIQERVAVIRIHAHAGAKGLGSITATVDPTGAIAELNESNNTASLSVNVK